jgi:hypothetical protein
MSGFAKSKSGLSVAAMELFCANLERRGNCFHRLENFLAAEFEDGCDALYIGIKESPEPTDIQISNALIEFDRIANVRRQVIIGVRHLAYEHGIALERSNSGVWMYQQGIATSSIQVGAALTRLASDYTAEKALIRLLDNSWLPKVSADQAATLVSHTSPPVSEAVWKEQKELEPLFGSNILSLDCSAEAEETSEAKNSEELLSQLAPYLNSPGQIVLNEVVKRVGSKRFSFDISSKQRAADITFTD